jgi:hypothetical protein
MLGLAVALLCSGAVPPAATSDYSGSSDSLFPTLRDRPNCFLPSRPDGGLDPTVQASLRALAQEVEAPAAGDADSAIAAGITYLGQFIVHDVSFVSTSRPEGAVVGAALRNLRSAALDLDSLYGRGPLDQPYLYERLDRSETAGPRLLVGHRLNPADLARDTAGRATGRALIGDPRNDDNLIVSQLHLAFAAFHNAVVDRLAPDIANPQELFAQASAQVRRHYQWIVLHEFLRTIADPTVVDAVLAAPCNEFCGSRGPFVPVEFSMAAFRFGHSMVRASYGIAPGKSTTLEQMRREFTFRNPLTAGVPVGWEVDWGRFFWRAGARPAEANLARKIDVHVTPGLATEIGLLRAYTARVPSGQCVAGALGLPRLTTSQLVAGSPATTALWWDAGLLLERTPLWYYVLKEAQVVANGERLGPLGSRLVAEVLVNLVRAEHPSLLDAGGWRPTLGPRTGEFTMLDLLCMGGRVAPCLR